MAGLTAELGPGVVLHADQEFEFVRPIVVGDALRGAVNIVGAYQKTGRTAPLTFVVIETAWTEADTAAPVVTTRFTAVHQPSNPARTK